MPIASVASSGRPSLVTTCDTSGKRRDDLLDARRDGHRFLERDRRQLARLDQDRALVEARHELGADEPERADGRARPPSPRRAIVRTRWRIAPAEVTQVALAQPHEPRAPRGARRAIFSSSDEAAGTAVSASSSAPKMRRAHGDRHRPEHLPLEPFEREDRQVDGDDDQHAEQDRPRHLDGRRREQRQCAAATRRPGRPAAVASASARRRTKFSIITTAPSTIRPKSMAPSDIRFAETPNSRMPMKPHEHRQRNHRRDDQRRADVAQEEEQHDDDEQRALDQVAAHRRRRCGRSLRSGRRRARS